MGYQRRVHGRKSLRTVPCERLSIYSLRVALDALFAARDPSLHTSYPIYASEEEMHAQWSALPGVEPGNNKFLRLVRDAHCHEAAMWFTRYLSELGKQAFERENFLPLLPVEEQQTDGDDALIAF